jgi:hypothetical protein
MCSNMVAESWWIKHAIVLVAGYAIDSDFRFGILSE